MGIIKRINVKITTVIIYEPTLEKLVLPLVAYSLRIQKSTKSAIALLQIVMTVLLMILVKRLKQETCSVKINDMLTHLCEKKIEIERISI